MNNKEKNFVSAVIYVHNAENRIEDFLRVIANEIGNKFIKYLILPANYRFTWVETNGNSRIIRRVWGATRSQNSYNSGLWTDTYTTSVENQFKAMLPLNPITERLFYIGDDNQNQRLIISAMTDNPRVWKVSKCEDMLMGDFGLMRLTFVQVAFNRSVDFVDYGAKNPDGSNDVYAMYADYYESSVTPHEEALPTPSLTTCVLSASTGTIKVGGSYKTITATFYDSTGADITDTYLSELSTSSWSFFIDGNEVETGNLITVLEQSVPNKIKVKFTNDASYLSKILQIRCTVGEIAGQIDLEVTSL